MANVLVVGECLGVTRQTRGPVDNSFTVTTIHLIEPGGVEKTECDLVRDFRGTLPERGELVALDAFASSWASKSGSHGVQLRARSRNTELELALSQLVPVKAS